MNPFFPWASAILFLLFTQKPLIGGEEKLKEFTFSSKDVTNYEFVYPPLRASLSFPDLLTPARKKGKGQEKLVVNSYESSLWSVEYPPLAEGEMAPLMGHFWRIEKIYYFPQQNLDKESYAKTELRKVPPKDLPPGMYLSIVATVFFRWRRLGRCFFSPGP